MDANILINTEGAADQFTYIELSILTEITNRKTEYQNILALLQKAEGDHVEPLKSLLGKEADAVGKIGELLTGIIQMLREASANIKKVETNYAVNRVEE